MSPEPRPAPKPLVWIGDSLEVLAGFPQAVRSEMGFALYQAQTGGKHLNAKPLHGFWRGAFWRLSPTIVAIRFARSTR